MHGVSIWWALSNPTRKDCQCREYFPRLDEDGADEVI
jgi:hypothetical protein